MIEYLGVIHNRKDLIEVKKRLGVRPDWHEPDEQEVTAEVRGKSFDNAGFYGMANEAEMLARHNSDAGVEMYVRLFKEGQPVADVPLATLLAWATGYDDAGDMRPALASALASLAAHEAYQDHAQSHRCAYAGNKCAKRQELWNAYVKITG